MISIKRLMERNDEQLVCAALQAYRSVLGAMGESGVKACPPVGSKLRESLLRLQEKLSAGPEGAPDPGQLQETGEEAQAELDSWGSGAADYFRRRAEEVKELLMILACAAESAGERDQRYARQLEDFTGRLQAIADLQDLAEIRDSLLESANGLKACAAQMAAESQQSIARLREDVSVYQTRLDDAERLAGQDPLTRLDNRRRVEAAIESRIARGQPFSVLLLDLNGFKQMNDTLGHLAADEVLKQFAAELKSGFRATDVVGRWGGDEFVVVVDAGLQAATAHQARITRWVVGHYTVKVGVVMRKVAVGAAIGAAEWQPGDTMAGLLDRADAAMYRDKRAAAGSKI